MSAARRLLRRLRLRHLLFLLLVSSGIVPLTVAGALLVHQNRDLLETQEKAFLTRSAAALSREVSDDLGSLRQELLQVGAGLLSLPRPSKSEQPSLREPWIGSYLESFLRSNSSIVELQALDAEGAGPRYVPADLAGVSEEALDQVFREATATRKPAYRFAVLPRTHEPVAAISVPILASDGQLRLVVQAVARLRVIEAMLEREARDEFTTFLIDRDGQILWSEGASSELRRALAGSDLLRDFARKPLNLTAEFPMRLDGREVRMLARVSPVEETGWGVVVHKPASAAFQTARHMVWSVSLAIALLVVLALVFAAAAARLVGRPIQRLAETTHEIAAGNFGRRIEEEKMAFELGDLAADFNRMNGYVQEYVARLEAAAEENRELFISSIRAFAAAIDAKDPYTRGHSERVAELSRAIASHLGQSEEFQQRLWIGALLHDVGKIGIDDRVLKKGGVLTPAEFEQMKAHPGVGSEILAPIGRLRDMLPAIRWHHENWNGRGYPDGLKGEEIPLAARIVAVADCFDAITTNRPYQQAFAAPFALEAIRKSAGTRFDAKVVTAFLSAFEAGDISTRGEEGASEAELPAAASI